MNPGVNSRIRAARVPLATGVATATVAVLSWAAGVHRVVVTAPGLDDPALSPRIPVTTVETVRFDPGAMLLAAVCAGIAIVAFTLAALRASGAVPPAGRAPGDPARPPATPPPHTPHHPSAGGDSTAASTADPRAP